MIGAGTLLLNRSEVAKLLTLDETITAVENAFRLHGEGKALKPALMHLCSNEGEFHIKAGGLELERRYVAIKANSGFFQNMTRLSLPNIRGLVILYDGDHGYPLAVLDSTEITLKRTGAAVAIAARHLARPQSQVATIFGCGTQGRIQLHGLRSALPLRLVYAVDQDRNNAESFAAQMSKELSLKVLVAEDTGEAIRRSDVCVTCTPSRNPFLWNTQVAKGTFIAAMGADSPEKQELDPELLKANTVVVDLVDQCAEVGELHHAMEAGMRKEDVHAELGEIVAGKKQGRTSINEIIIFDSTGTALQDVASAAAVYRKALAGGYGALVDFLR